MSREEAVSLVRFINRHDTQHRAEAHFLRSPGSEAEAILLLTDCGSRNAVASVAHVEEYLSAFAPAGGTAVALP
jgi:hypothetical protein